MKLNIRVLSSTIIMMIIFVFSMTVAAETGSGTAKQQELVDRARITIDSFMSDADLKWFQENVKDAKGILIIPELLKGGFFLGGSGGRGILLVRNEQTGEWSGPAFYTIGSVSLGIQFGGKISEVVIMVLSQKGLDALYSSSFKFGGDLSIAVGPLGATAERATVSVREADYLSFARSKGMFAGISLDGAVVKTNDEWNDAYYGSMVTPRDILVTRTASNPGSERIRDAVRRAAARESRRTKEEGVSREEKSGEGIVEEGVRKIEEDSSEERPLNIEESDIKEKISVTGEEPADKGKTEIEKIREKYSR